MNCGHVDDLVSSAVAAGFNGSPGRRRAESARRNSSVPPTYAGKLKNTMLGSPAVPARRTRTAGATTTRSRMTHLNENVQRAGLAGTPGSGPAVGDHLMPGSALQVGGTSVGPDLAGYLLRILDNENAGLGCWVGEVFVARFRRCRSTPRALSVVGAGVDPTHDVFVVRWVAGGRTGCRAGLAGPVRGRQGERPGAVPCRCRR